MQAAWLALVYLAIITLGAAAPFAFSLGYVWVDVFSPQLIASAILNSIPVSLIMAVLALGSYFMMDRKDTPKLSLLTGLTILMAIWVTLTTTWAVSPPDAWPKWDWAFKSLLMSAFLPFVFRSRVQIEAFLLVVVLSLAGHFLPYGAKNLISGGGYGQNLGLVAGNSGIAEGSTFAGLCVMTIPLMLYFKDHGIVLPRVRWVRIMWWALIAASVSAVISTYERTGLVALAVLGIHIWLKSKRKVLTAGILAIIVIVGSGLLAASYSQRISTITTYQSDTSAYGRVLVWKWTLGFVATHPLGGGFNAYVVDSFVGQLPTGEEFVFRGKAFHSIYFEILGEHGFPGFVIFMTMLALAFLYYIGVRRTARRVADLTGGHPGRPGGAARAPGARPAELAGTSGRTAPPGQGASELDWSRALATELMGGLAILMTAGLFVSNAMQPEIPYLIGAAACLRGHVTRAAAEILGTRGPARGWSRPDATGRRSGAPAPATRIAHPG